mmetsp:Transcript_2697/g.5694  ORF Transcript_2697/g.5694 Transcript_2697/m.5694 type:complete len:484 (+) Transcript_2697:936-2387(+)
MLNVVEGVLGDVGEAHVGVLVHLAAALTLVGQNLADEHLDHRRLARAVHADDGNAGCHRDLDGDVVERVDLARGVLEGAVDHLHEGLGLGGDALEHARIREREGDVLRLELVVGLSLGDELDELGEIALVHLELAVLLVVAHVLGDIVEEDGVVGDDHRRDLLVAQSLDVLGQPGDAVHVDVVGRLIEQQKLGLLEHRARERQPHAPAARERADGAKDERVSEGARAHHLNDVLLGLAHRLDHRVHVDELPADVVGVGGGHVALDVHRTDLLGETLDEVSGDRAHQCRLASTVGANEAIALATLELELGVVQEHAVTVGKGERAVAQHLEVIVVLDLLLLDASAELGGRRLEELLAEHNGLGLGQRRPKVGRHHVHRARPSHGEERRGHLGDPLGDLVGLVRVAEEDLGQHSLNINWRAVDSRLGVLAKSDLDGVERLLALGAHLRHRDLLDKLAELLDQGRSEILDVLRVVDKLEHGVNDNS